jgi:hypothetical protein
MKVNSAVNGPRGEHRAFPLLEGMAALRIFSFYPPAAAFPPRMRTETRQISHHARSVSVSLNVVSGSMLWCELFVRPSFPSLLRTFRPRRWPFRSKSKFARFSEV